MMEHRFKVYAAVLPFLMRYVPADVRAYSSFLLYAVVHLLSAALLLLFSPLLYFIERVHSRRQRLPASYSHILITGASSGVGEGLAYAYSKPGVRVVLVARNEEQLQLVADKCRAQGAEAVPCVMDVRDRAGMERIVEQAEAVKPLDLTLAVAGHESALSKDEDIMHAAHDAVDVNMSPQPLTHARALHCLCSTVGSPSPCLLCRVSDMGRSTRSCPASLTCAVAVAGSWCSSLLSWATSARRQPLTTTRVKPSCASSARACARCCSQTTWR